MLGVVVVVVVVVVGVVVVGTDTDGVSSRVSASARPTAPSVCGQRGDVGVVTVEESLVGGGVPSAPYIDKVRME